MSPRLKLEVLEQDLSRLGISEGDTILIRADLGKVGRVSRQQFVNALLNVVGTEGTIVSLAFTAGGFIWSSAKLEPFTTLSPSYAGALPNAMLAHPQAVRSTHPQCSYVAIGKHAKYITAGHDANAGAYEPVRKVMELNGRSVLIGCVSDSPGFTTAHLAEIDLGLHNRTFMKWLMISRYYDENKKIKIFHRRDPGLCSNSFWKFYAYYIKAEFLKTGMVGGAYSILADAARCYDIEKELLRRDPRFNVCGSPDCVLCNAMRWDRIYCAPRLVIRRLLERGLPSKREGC